MTFDIISLVVNIFLGGSLIVTLVTIRATKKKADAEAKGTEIDNDEKASRLLMDYIVEPLKKEINALRKEVRKLQRSIDRISDCPYADGCPVRGELQKPEGCNVGNEPGAIPGA